MRPGHLVDRTASTLVGLATAVAVAATVLLASVRPGPAASPAGLDLAPTIPVTGALRSVAGQTADAGARLVLWLATVGWGVLALGLITALALATDRAARLRPAVAIHRAVGAARGTLFRTALRDGLGLALASVAAGGAVGVGLSRWVGPAWPGAVSAFAAPLAIVAAAVAVILGIAWCFPLLGTTGRDPSFREEAPAPLRIASVQIGAAIAVLVAGATIMRQAAQTLGPATSAGPLAPAAAVFRIAARDGRPLDLDDLLRRNESAPGSLSIAGAGGHLGQGPIDELMTDCGNCYVGGIVLKWRPLQARYLTVSADTFKARGLTVVEGRALGDGDRAGAEPVAVVNVHLARRYFENGRPIGRSIYPAGRLSGQAYRVVGIVEDEGPAGFGAADGPLETVYLSVLQHPAAVAEVVTTDGRTPAFGPRTVVEVRESGAAYLRRAVAPLAWFGRAFAGAGIVALLLALGGTGALLLIWVRSMATEFAIRRATGARRLDLLGLVARQTMSTAAIGVGIALIFFGPAIWPELGAVVPGVPGWSPDLIVGAAGLLTLTAIAAAIPPAVAASRATPADLWSR
ncbi:MAG: ABC transporter permease [Gemmatimonadales bacterium]